MFKKSNIPGDVTPKPASKEKSETAAAATPAPEAKKADEPAAADPAKDAKKA